MKELKNILISRTDSIGDVVLTMPLVGWLKINYPAAKIHFLAQPYTFPVLECNSDIDQIHDVNKLDTIQQQFDVVLHVFPNKIVARWAKAQNIPIRVGTSHRFFHLLTCNKRVNFTRKKSELHESQLNFNLLKPIGLQSIPKFSEVSYYLNFTPQLSLNKEVESKIDGKFVILHPGSRGSAVDYPVEKFMNLANLLVENGFSVFFTGTENEGKTFRSKIPKTDKCHDVSGKMSLAELIIFIKKSSGLVAASTGPLHIAGILNVNTIGLFSSVKPIHPGRWQPLGENVTILCNDENKDDKPTTQYILESEIVAALQK